MGDREYRRVLKKSDINRDIVSMCIRRVAAITSLKSGITEEDTLYGFGCLSCLGLRIWKKQTNQRHEGEVEEGLVWKNDGIRDLIM